MAPDGTLILKNQTRPFGCNIPGTMGIIKRVGGHEDAPSHLTAVDPTRWRFSTTSICRRRPRRRTTTRSPFTSRSTTVRGAISGTRRRGRVLSFDSVFGSCGLVACPCRRRRSKEKRILKAMSDYATGRQHIQLKYDVDIEVITPHVEKLQFGSSGEMSLSRPDKLRATRTGATRMSSSFEGKTVTVFGKDSNTFAQLEAPGSLDQMIDRLRAERHSEMPGADLLLSDMYDELVAGATEAKHIGRGVVDVSSANIWPSAMRKRRYGWSLGLAPFQGNTSSPARPWPQRRNTRCGSRHGIRTRPRTQRVSSSPHPRAQRPSSFTALSDAANCRLRRKR